MTPNKYAKPVKIKDIHTMVAYTEIKTMVAKYQPEGDDTSIHKHWRQSIRRKGAPNDHDDEASATGRDENGTEIFRTDRFRFLYYDTVFYIMTLFPNFAKHKKLSFSIGFTTIFNHFLYPLITKI